MTKAFSKRQLLPDDGLRFTTGTVWSFKQSKYFDGSRIFWTILTGEYLSWLYIILSISRHDCAARLLWPNYYLGDVLLVPTADLLWACHYSPNYLFKHASNFSQILQKCSSQVQISGVLIFQCFVCGCDCPSINYCTEVFVLNLLIFRIIKCWNLPSYY